MDGREAEIAKLQTALRMADKLAMLCRELLRAEKAGDLERVSCLAGETEALVTSAEFARAVQETGEENFYPSLLRKKLEWLSGSELQF